MPLDPRTDPLVTLEAQRDAGAARKAELEADRAELTYRAAIGDKTAQKRLEELRAESERVLMELNDTVQAIEVAKVRAKAAHEGAAKQRMQAAARNAESHLAERDAAAVELGVAARQFKAAAHRFLNAGIAARNAVELMVSEAASAQVPVDGNTLHRLSALTLPGVAAAEFLRDCHLLPLFEHDSFAVGEAGQVMIDWSVQRDPAGIAEHAKAMNQQLRAALVQYV